MSKFEFSVKLTDYLKKIENETGKEVRILESPYLGLKGMWAGFRYHPDYIIIIIRSDIQKTNETLERSIAHEATHGYILFKKKYCRGEFPESIEDSDKRDIQLIFTMVDDIVVNKIIFENGFTPFGVEYLAVVQKEIDSMLTGVDFYRQFSDDLLFDDLLMITRYIIAWGFLEYFNLKHEEYGTLKKYVDVFKDTYPLQYEITNQIKQIIKDNDIFTSSGHCKTMTLILKLLKFDKLVKITNM
ncbi:hypothetical protein [Methanobacterium sp.]|uniref:hypothetical protein n=1 Tax=Methanobacterium sp. TaxID=2164 RepID=UPI003C717821